MVQLSVSIKEAIVVATYCSYKISEIIKIVANHLLYNTYNWDLVSYNYWKSIFNLHCTGF